MLDSKFRLEMSVANFAIQTSGIITNKGLQMLANCEHAKYQRKLLDENEKSYIESMNNHVYYAYNYIPIKPGKLIEWVHVPLKMYLLYCNAMLSLNSEMFLFRNRVNVATDVLTIRDHIIKGTLHGDDLEKLLKDLEKSRDDMSQ